MTHTADDSPIFYPDLGDLSTPEPGHAEGLTLKLYERTDPERKIETPREP